MQNVNADMETVLQGRSHTRQVFHLVGYAHTASLSSKVPVYQRVKPRVTTVTVKVKVLQRCKMIFGDLVV